MQQANPTSSLDPLIKVVYLMTRTEEQYLARPITEFVGSGPDLARTYSGESQLSMTSTTARRRNLLGRTPSNATVRPDSAFRELTTKLDEFNRGYDIGLGELHLDHEASQTFQAMIVQFDKLWRPLAGKTIENTLQKFQVAAATVIRSTDPTNASLHLLYYVYFIDLLFSLRTLTQEHKAVLNQKRYDSCQKKISPNINVSRLPKFQFIASIYKVPMQHITNRVLALKGQCGDNNILNEFNQKQGHFHYQQADFAEIVHYLEWKKGRDALRNKGLERFQQQREIFSRPNARAPPVSPPDTYQTLDLIIHQMLESSIGIDACGLQILQHCCFVWQLDGYETFITVFKTFLRISDIKHDLSIALKGRDIGRKLMEFCCLPYNPEIWPIALKDQAPAFDRINTPLMESAAIEMNNIFDIDSLGRLLIILLKIKNNSPFGVSETMKRSFLSKLTLVEKERFRERLDPVPGRGVTMEDVFSFLENIIVDILYLNSELLRDFESRYKDDWNISDHIKTYLGKNAISTVKKIMGFMTTQLSFDVNERKFIRSYKIPPLNDSVENVLTDITSIREFCSFSPSVFPSTRADFYFPDYYSNTVDICRLADEHCTNAIETDTYETLPDVGYSISVKNLFAYFEERILNYVELLNWPKDIHNAYFLTLVYESISEILTRYANRLTSDVIKDLTSVETLPETTVSYTKINNLYNVLKNMDTIFRDDVLQEFSVLIRNHMRVQERLNGASGSGTMGGADHLNEIARIKRGKLISIKVEKAENVEDRETGKPLNSFVKLAGAIDDKTRTRTIVDDSYPEWNEEFESVLEEGHNDHLQIRLFAEINSNESRIIESFAHQLTFDPRKDGLIQQIKLSNHGVNLYLNYKFETIRHDPIFYNGKARTSLLTATQRIIKLLGTRCSKQIMETFTKENIRNAFKQTPTFVKVEKFLTEEGDIPLDPELINDAIVVNLCKTIANTVSVLSFHLEADAIDELLLYMWSVILTTGINVVLPPLAVTGSIRMNRSQQSQNGNGNLLGRITTQLNALGLDAGMSEPLNEDEMERLVSWLYKLFSIICQNLDESVHYKLMQSDSYKLLHQLINMQLLYYYDFQELQIEYDNYLEKCKELMKAELKQPIERSGILSRTASVMKQGTISDRVKESEEEDENVEKERLFMIRELILRVILAKEGVKSVDYVNAREAEFQQFSTDVRNKMISRRIINRNPYS